MTRLVQSKDYDAVSIAVEIGGAKAKKQFKISGSRFNPDSAVEIEADVRARYKPGAAKTQKRIVSRLVWRLARRCAFPTEITLCTEAEWPLRGRGSLSSLCRAYAVRSTLLPTAESRFNSFRTEH